ncbi:Protein F54B11.10 [Aphelenchoides avenae]|nr:Protein F54B11.10 [Aphelenchus avenae]
MIDKVLCCFLATWLLLDLLVPVGAASCSSNEYCPRGWTVKRRKDGSAHTCDPTDRVKCPKPYTCVASRCGINFCCGNDKMLDRMAQMEEDEADAKEESTEEINAEDEL